MFLVACSVLGYNCKPWRFLWNYLIFGLVHPSILKRKFNTIFWGQDPPCLQAKREENTNREVTDAQSYSTLWTQRFRTSFEWGPTHCVFPLFFLLRTDCSCTRKYVFKFYLKKGKMNNARRLKNSKCDTPVSESYKIVLVSHTLVKVWKSGVRFPTRKKFFSSP